MVMLLKIKDPKASSLAEQPYRRFRQNGCDQDHGQECQDGHGDHVEPPEGVDGAQEGHGGPAQGEHEGKGRRSEATHVQLNQLEEIHL